MPAEAGPPRVLGIIVQTVAQIDISAARAETSGSNDCSDWGDMVNPSRRQFLATAGALVATASLARFSFAEHASQPVPAQSTGKDQRYKISASDWMMLKRQTPGALDRAAECGLDGIEVDMGPLGKRPTFDDKLLDDKFRSDYLAKAKSLGLESARSR